MENAEELIPELLCYVRVPRAETQQVAAAAADIDSDDFSWDDGEDHTPPSLEATVAAKIPGARVVRVAAAAPKGALLSKCVTLAKTNMRQFASSEAELDQKRDEIAMADVIAILVGEQLLAFTAYLINEREGEHVVTYLLERCSAISPTRAARAPAPCSRTRSS